MNPLIPEPPPGMVVGKIAFGESTAAGAPDKFEVARRHLADNLPSIIATMAITAKMHRAKYLALIEAGFTPEQALELCKVVP